MTLDVNTKKWKLFGRDYGKNANRGSLHFPFFIFTTYVALNQLIRLGSVQYHDRADILAIAYAYQLTSANLYEMNDLSCFASGAPSDGQYDKYTKLSGIQPNLSRL